MDAKNCRKYEQVHLLSDDAIGLINALAFQPVMLVRIARRLDADPIWIQCPTRREAPAFVVELAKLPEFKDSKFLQALERAICQEIYESAALLFTWGMEPDNAYNISLLHGLPVGAKCYSYAGYPVFSLEPASCNASPSEKANILSSAVYAYKSASNCQQLWRDPIEAFGLALSRILGEQGEYEAAVQIVDDVMSTMPYSIHLKAAKHALELKLNGNPVPDRLVKFIGKDKGYLGQFICDVPFNRFDIGPSGEVLVCCGHWLPKSIGNFIHDSIDDVLNSNSAQNIRRSIVEGTYKYCNHLDCTKMIRGYLSRRDEINDQVVLKAICEGNYKVDKMQHALFAFDQTCNLSCPSCRRERIVEKASLSEAKARAVEQKLLPVLSDLKVLQLNTAGELLAGRLSRKILKSINDESCPELTLELISNGTLFSEKEWNKFPGIHNKIMWIRISIDAVEKTTFEKLRRGGKYESFLGNMQFLAGLRKNKIIPALYISFTYQLDNFREMADFVRFGLAMNCDQMIFERLQSMGTFTHTKFCELAVHRPDHPLHQEFLDVISDPIFWQAAVWHDFDYEVGLLG